MLDQRGGTAAGSLHVLVGAARNNETLHLSSYSLAGIGRPTLKDDALHFRIGSTEELLASALLWAFWIYAQTVTLVLDIFELGVSAELQGR
jgi:hypothetical protein